MKFILLYFIQTKINSITRKISLTAVEAIQVANILKLSRGEIRMQEDKHGLKCALVAANNKCWHIGSGPLIVENRNKCRCRVTKRVKPNSFKGCNKFGACYETKTEVELNLFKFSFALENKLGKNTV